MTGPAWYPFAVQELLDESDGADYGGPLTISHGLVLHVQAGANDPGSWFDRPAVQASSHWWVAETGRLAQYVPADRQAWAQAAGNSGWHSVETEGVPAEPLTPPQIATLARLYAWGHATWGWPLQLADTVAGTGLGTHGMGGAAWGGHTGCPGPARTAQRTQILTAAASGQTGGDVATGDDLRKVLDEGTAQGQGNWAGTSKATLGGVQADINVDQADLTVDKSNAAALARIEAALGSLVGAPGPLTAGQIVAALPELVRADVALVVAAGVQLLAAG